MDFKIFYFVNSTTFAMDCPLVLHPKGLEGLTRNVQLMFIVVNSGATSAVFVLAVV